LTRRPWPFAIQQRTLIEVKPPLDASVGIGGCDTRSKLSFRGNLMGNG